MGGGRTDAGYLGAGLYFAPRLRDAARYATPSAKAARRTRFALVAEVALGNSASFQTRQPKLTAAPSGFDSCRGLGPDEAVGGQSEFAHPEFVVYRREQVRLRYLLEFQMPDDLPSTGGPAASAAPLMARPVDKFAPAPPTAPPCLSPAELEARDALAPAPPVAAGLVGGAEGAVPLLSVHVRGVATDLAARVCVFQQ